MNRLRNSLFRMTSLALVVGLMGLMGLTGLTSLPAVADTQQARAKDGTRQRARDAGREAPRAEVFQGASVSITPDRKFVREGDTVRLTVKITGAENVGHVPFHLTFDSTVLRFERGTEGSFLKANDSGTVFLATPGSAGSAVVVGLSRLGRADGVTGEGDLCTLEFTAIGSGPAKLDFTRASVRAPDNRAIPSQFIPANLDVR